jgi:hypothetical protein
MTDKENYKRNRLQMIKYYIYNELTTKELKEIQIDVEEAIVNKE